MQVQQQLIEWQLRGTEEEKAFAEAKLKSTKVTDDLTKTVSIQTQTLQVMSDAAEGFFDNLGALPAMRRKFSSAPFKA